MSPGSNADVLTQLVRDARPDESAVCGEQPAEQPTYRTLTGQRHTGLALPTTVSDMGIATELLRTSWEASGLRLQQRCDGLTDDEYFWSPVPDAWTVKPDPYRPGRWTYDYDFAPPPPAPVTTISWRLVHIIADNEIYWEYAFGPGRRTFPDLEVPQSARQAMEVWWESRRPISRWLGWATDADLAEPRPSHLGDPRTAGEVVRILLDEQTHHGAEIALLRDLYLRR